MTKKIKTAVLYKPDIVEGCDGSSCTDGAAEDNRGRSQVSHKTCCIVFTVVQYKHCHVDSDELKKAYQRQTLNLFKNYSINYLSQTSMLLCLPEPFCGFRGSHGNPDMRGSPRMGMIESVTVFAQALVTGWTVS